MSNFMLAFHGGKMPETPEEGAKIMAKWGVWMEGLGSALVNPGAILGMSKTLAASGVSDDGGANPLSGYMIIKADNIDAAIEMGKTCPIIENGGTIEIAEEKEM